jgi:chemotaxis protein CheZ
MSLANTQALDDLIGQIRRSDGAEVSLADVVRLAELSTEAFRSFFAGLDSAMLRELREIADYINAMRCEIGTLQANDIKNSRIPAAGQQLDAIVQATEEATHTIMGCAEAVMAGNAADPVAYKALVDANMMLVFEACSFQDITGQRIAKVVETLQHIENRVSRFAAAVGVGDIAGPANEAERLALARRARLLMHGPQLDGIGAHQGEVDLLLAPENRRGNTQSEIDRLMK